MQGMRVDQDWLSCSVGSKCSMCVCKCVSVDIHCFLPVYLIFSTIEGVMLLNCCNNTQMRLRSFHVSFVPVVGMCPALNGDGYLLLPAHMYVRHSVSLSNSQRQQITLNCKILISFCRSANSRLVQPGQQTDYTRVVASAAVYDLETAVYENRQPIETIASQSNVCL